MGAAPQNIRLVRISHDRTRPPQPQSFLPVILGLLLASGRRTVSCWLSAAGVSDDWREHYYFLQTVGRSVGSIATRLLALAVRQIPASHVDEFVQLAIDDSPTKRYGPQVELAGIHHNPTPGPSGSEFLYGHVWVTLSWLVQHPLWGCIGLPLHGLLYVRRKDLDLQRNSGIGRDNLTNTDAATRPKRSFC